MLSALENVQHKHVENMLIHAKSKRSTYKYNSLSFPAGMNTNSSKTPTTSTLQNIICQWGKQNTLGRSFLLILSKIHLNLCFFPGNKT